MSDQNENLDSQITEDQEVRKEPVGPSVAELKAKFAQRTIPLQEDFAALIDIADSGRKSFGGSPDQDPSQWGYDWNSIGKYQVKLNFPFYLEEGKSIAIKVAKPINASGALTVALAQEVVLINGKLGITPGDGLEIDSNQALKIKVASGGGLTVDEQGLKVDEANLAADYFLPRGTVLPNYSSHNENPPAGWGWCDGKEGRPNIQDRIIYSDTLANVGNLYHRLFETGDSSDSVSVTFRYLKFMIKL